MDISRILDGWEFDPDRPPVRIVAGDDGREKVQMRLELGLLQFEMDGRPDGRRPEGHESWLEYYRVQAEEAARNGADFRLDHEDCQRLESEGLQYYHRYLSFWFLARYDLCARDTARNLDLFSFVCRHASREQDKLEFDRYRPYVLMMHCRALATPRLESNDYSGALEAVDWGIDRIRDFLRQYEQTHREKQCDELIVLARLRAEIVAQQQGAAEGKGTLGEVERLRHELNKAVAEEEFEAAARLRDEIRRRTV